MPHVYGLRAEQIDFQTRAAALAAGELAALGGLSQLLRSRQKALLIFLGITAVGFATFFLLPPATPNGFYARCVLTGLGIGFWANMVTNAAEQFGTNVRATVTVTVPNLVRAIFVPISSAYLFSPRTLDTSTPCSSRHERQ